MILAESAIVCPNCDNRYPIENDIIIIEKYNLEDGDVVNWIYGQSYSSP
jgi:hypothetical protein